MKPVSAASLGFKVGDFVFTGAFPGIIISDVRTSTPCCEVFGFEQELGSCYAHDLRHLSRQEFLDMCVAGGHDLPLRPHSDVSKAALDGTQQ